MVRFRVAHAVAGSRLAGGSGHRRRSADASRSKRTRLTPFRGTDERGAAAVEAAIVLPLILLMFLGMVELTVLMKSHLEVTSLAREGARTASSEPRLPNFYDDAVAAIVRSASAMDYDRVKVWVYDVPSGGDGAPPSSCGTSTCMSFSWTGGGGPPTRSGTWDPSTINACLRDPAAQSVGVYVQASHDWMFQLFPDSVPADPGSNTWVKSRSVMKFEPVIPKPAAVGDPWQKCKP